MMTVHDRASIDEAALLIARLGTDAAMEAATFADAARDHGDLDSFCRWRQIERAILILQLEDVVGELH